MARTTQFQPMDPDEMGFDPPPPPEALKRSPNQPRPAVTQSRDHTNHDPRFVEDNEPPETEHRPIIVEASETVTSLTGTSPSSVPTMLPTFGNYKSDMRRRFIDYSEDVHKRKRFSRGPYPTYCQYYTFKDIAIRPLAYIDLPWIAQAQKTGDEAIILDVVQSCIDVPLHELSFGDLIFIMHWLRKNSYTRSPQMITWNCAHCEARWRKAHKEMRPYEMLPANLQTELDDARGAMQKLLAANSTKIIDIDPPVPLDPDLDIPRVGVYLEYMEFCKTYPDREHFAKVALYVKGETLGEKFAALEAAPDLDLWERACVAAAAIGDHGVSDYVNVECHNPAGQGECGAKTTRFLAVKLLTFLA